ncbi:hypothetical protein D9611_001181 [Ephemerocybe angulata]|uniref:Protein PBN1 n=1 Tax=Ephemerocybe angulata TaxID=980116 RepID=A0A8H5CJZ1_9AGAR|nr:hypothetical protein D9611_001181 [Tulosesus angulatus]
MVSKLSTNSTLSPSYGSHPTIITDVQISLSPTNSDTTCTLFLHYELPPLLFVDPYELELRGAEYQVLETRGRGKKELERPVHALPVNEGDDDEEVEVVIQRTLPAETTGPARVELPIHVRYGEPVASSTSKPYTVQEFSGPTVVLTCSDEVLSCDRTTTLPQFLLDTIPTSLRDLSLCVASQSPEQSLAISAPIGNTLDLPTVELGTTAVVLACFAWVAWEAWRAGARLREGASSKVKSN